MAHAAREAPGCERVAHVVDPLVLGAGRLGRRRALARAEVVDVDAPPSAAGKWMPSRCGSSFSASTTLARSGICSRDRTVLAQCLSRPLANARRTASNKPFSGWGEIFGDDVVAAAMIDRLVHHAEIQEDDT
jgi:IstB-like ATP binding protein